MKKLFVIIIFIAGLILTSNGQRNSYGLNFGFGNGTIMKKELDGGASYDLNTGYSIGLHYDRKFTNRLHLMTSINIYNNSFTVTPSFYPGNDMLPKDYDVRLIYVPLELKIDLSKYFYITGGLIGDIDISKDKYITNQSGLGVVFGIGVEFSIYENFLVQLTPYLNFHGLVPKNREDYPERVFDSGVKLNLIIRK